ncbi:hypothetical protein BS47DRAFT_1393743 [Hydnum rufescens UP504]|uniref:Uncharacterized protein n=1 Tax=Hydnum rufescens UP504 TaxID=1448309 RepID=A0A9P6AW33_9AGAM|nr:hypothetical protein BS47DRAFT_1393743 [Hydnum rufescens UP504]
MGVPPKEQVPSPGSPDPPSLNTVGFSIAASGSGDVGPPHIVADEHQSPAPTLLPLPNPHALSPHSDQPTSMDVDSLPDAVPPDAGMDINQDITPDPVSIHTPCSHLSSPLSLPPTLLPPPTCACFHILPEFEQGCGHENDHTEQLDADHIAYLAQLFQALDQYLPPSDDTYFPTSPLAWSYEILGVLEDEDEGIDGNIKCWFMSSYQDQHALALHDVSLVCQEEAATTASKYGLSWAHSLDMSVFWACGERSQELIKAL